MTNQLMGHTSSPDSHMTPATHVDVKMSSASGEVDDEIVLPGVVSGSGAFTEAAVGSRALEPTLRASDPAEPEEESDEDEEVCFSPPLLCPGLEFISSLLPKSWKMWRRACQKGCLA